MEPNIDDIDRRIVQELQRDARRPNKALAEAVGTSPSTMLNRVRALERRSVITGYHAAVDHTAIGRPIEAMVSVRLQPKTPTAVNEFTASVWNLPETVSVTMLTGGFDVLIHLAVSDVTELGRVVLTNIASSPNVVDEQTSLIFQHRTKHVTT